MNAPRPIEIVGGGLAGLSLGTALCNHGVETTIFEAGSYPRHRVCGEFITGLPKHTIQRLQLAPILRDARLNREVSWFAKERMVRRHQLPSPAPSLSRYVLDARLADAFVTAGGKLVTNTRLPVNVNSPGRIFSTGRRRAEGSWLGLKLHARGLRLHSDLELHLGNQAYVGLAGVEEDRVNICGLFERNAGGVLPAIDARRRPGFTPDMSGVKPDLRAKTASSNPRSEILLRCLRGCGLEGLAHRFVTADIDENSFCAVAALGFDARVSLQTELRLGDACAMVPPFTGHGMAMAFQSAEIALDPLVTYAHGRIEWPETRRQIQLALRSRFRTRLATATALHSFLLAPRRQRWLALFNRAHLLPLRPIYSALH